LRKYDLEFINDSDFFNHVKDTVSKYRFQIDLNKFSKNLVDPIKLTFDSKVYNKQIDDVIENEIIRQMDKSNTNHIGYFHQNIFNYIGKGWSVPRAGYDVVNLDKNYFVEMKNKHNTMNSSSSQKTYMRMQNTLLNNSNATCMLVEAIAKNSQNVVWNVSLDGNSVANDKIRRVSIDKFYELVTGDPQSFRRLCEKLPIAIDDVMSATQLDGEVNTVVAELKQISPNILKSLYLLSFRKYEGFDEFHL
jgi:hypothetical protein